MVAHQYELVYDEESALTDHQTTVLRTNYQSRCTPFACCFTASWAILLGCCCVYYYYFLFLPPVACECSDSDGVASAGLVKLTNLIEQCGYTAPYCFSGLDVENDIEKTIFPFTNADGKEYRCFVHTIAFPSESCYEVHCEEREKLVALDTFYRNANGWLNLVTHDGSIEGEEAHVKNVLYGQVGDARDFCVDREKVQAWQVLSQLKPNPSSFGTAATAGFGSFS